MTKVICDLRVCVNNNADPFGEAPNGICQAENVEWFAIYTQDEDWENPVERAQLCKKFKSKFEKTVVTGETQK